MDKWCRKMTVDGKTLSGGAARNVRISRRGGMENIIADAVQYALNLANAAACETKKAKVSRFRAA